MQKFKVIRPSPILAPFVKHYWIMRIEGSEPVSERTVPIGSANLVFHRGGLMNSLTAGSVQPRSFLSGVNISYTDLAGSTGVVDMITVVFQPFGVAAFFSVPLDEFRDGQVSVDDISDHALHRLEDEIMSRYDDGEAIRLIEGYLLSRLRVFKDHNLKRITAAVRVVNSSPQANVEAMSGAACLSPKQFGRIFSSHVGTGPKDFIRIVRFQRALHTMQLNPGISMAQLAFDSNYYDQPHMIREFKRLSGYTPSEYTAACAPFSDYFSYK